MTLVTGVLDAWYALLSQWFTAFRQRDAIAVLRSLLVLSRHTEARRGNAASVLAAATRSLRALLALTRCCALVGTAFLSLTPLLTGRLTIRAWPLPDHDRGEPDVDPVAVPTPRRMRATRPC